VNSEKRRGERYADSIFDLFDGGDSLRVEIDSTFREHAIDALQDRGCVVQRELNSDHVTVYLQTNRQIPEAMANFHLG